MLLGDLGPAAPLLLKAPLSSHSIPISILSLQSVSEERERKKTPPHRPTGAEKERESQNRRKRNADERKKGTPLIGSNPVPGEGIATNVSFFPLPLDGLIPIPMHSLLLCHGDPRK